MMEITDTRYRFFTWLEKGLICLGFTVFFFAVIYHPEDPVFIGEFNNEDGSIYASRAVDVLVSLVIFFTVVFRLIPRQLLRARYASFALGSLLLVGSVCAVEYGLDQGILRLFNLPSGPWEISDKLLSNPRRNLYYSTIVPGNTMVYLLALLYGVARDWIAKARRESQLQKETMRASIDFLRSQINPHFFFNALNNIYAITRRNKDTEAGDAIIKLSAVMRYMIYDSDVETIGLDKEIAHIREYLDLVRLKYRPDDPLDLTMNVKGKPGRHRIAPLILQPFVENGCKHGLTSAGEGYVHVDLSVEEREIVFVVENSRTGKQEVHRKHSGIGLENVRRRLELLYPDRHDLVITESDDTFTVTLTIRFEE
ncbi:histidine kinase [bacterium]|nr:histidine kinase [bacterium]